MWARVSVDLLKKQGKFVTKIFLADNVEWSSKNLWKMSAANDVKTSTKQQEIKDLVAHLINFYTRITFKTWSICNVNSRCIFQLILVGILSILILSVKNRRGPGWFLLNGKNLLDDKRMTKIICWQALSCVKPRPSTLLD